jgi:phage gpG-like protein
MVQYEVRAQNTLARQMQEVEKRLAANAIYSLKGAAYEVTTRAKALIVRSKRASKPGDPPHTRGIRQKSLKASIWYAVDKAKQDAVIGPRHSFVADMARVHEFGGERRGKRGTAKYPARPFMAVALAKTLPKIPDKFKSLVST